MLEKYGHGGDLWTAAETFGKSKEQFLDYSSNMNPLGPPAIVEQILRDHWRDLAAYPDPAVRELRSKLADRYKISVESILVGNGAAELIDLAVRVLQPAVMAVSRPSFSEYEEAAEKAGGRILDIPLHAYNHFELQLSDVEHARAASDLLFLGSPNNPTGRLLSDPIKAYLAKSGKPVIIDEAFIDFSPEEEQLTMIRIAAQSNHLMVIRSMTKFYSIPGLRLGFIVAHPDQIRRLQQLQVQWSVNMLAQLVGIGVMADHDYEQRTHKWLAKERPWLIDQLQQLGLHVTPSDTNYLLFSLSGLGLTAKEMQQEMGQRGVLIRDASRFHGLDATYIRVAIRLREQNERLIAALQDSLEALAVQHSITDRNLTITASGAQVDPMQADLTQIDETKTDAPERLRTVPRIPQKQQQAPTLMVQGTSSDAGKSLITTAFCRIFLQDGYLVAPFKSQNMSLNSYVTIDGKEIGRAQGMQADACRIAATTDMNPILLKPKKDMVAQVVVHGKPYRDFDARTYREKYLLEAEMIVKDSLQRLREAYDLVVIEGAGSPAEVNLKDRDIVNMRLAGWADAPVVLVADIDRGGVFASLLGTIEIFTPEERDRVKGFIINKFRGDVTLLKPGLDWLEARTGKPVLGVIPYLPDLELEDEDSASLDRKLSVGSLQSRSNETNGHTDGTDQLKLDIAVIRLPRLSNFTDVDPLLYEQDVHVRYVSSPHELGSADAIVIPGSKNTVDDLLFLRETGLEKALLEHARQGGHIVGICAGYQMLGERLLDPLHTESDRPETEGLGLLPIETIFAADKRTVRTSGTTRLFAADDEVMTVSGYEIHMGQTRFLQPVSHPFQLHEEQGEQQSHPDGAITDNGKVWGTYVHGILHNDVFRRSWLNELRRSRGWGPKGIELAFQDRREKAFDRLADHVRSHLDMTRLYEMIGIDRQV
ncbi:L-threonine O-3-phosphate decarboxylase /adenosylcobyric acid synthase (glutamine-hydrolysing) [Paenibacillus sp. 1_12]|uniref:cobyric acid synthase n=1 Tax=Paenibacillus sp. 1_12 TaxID=1566278 RepID=UPI0008F2C771|nr:L-threonine O-3-phosphate decarboxylase /adenosylcobyric acid synthase (glutamine-hydrolysing) [Paenibacillus sp. 1_12]